MDNKTVLNGILPPIHIVPYMNSIIFFLPYYRYNHVL